ncbi:MAG TPA: TIGR01777 family oxidoreductase [Vicinamibacterales bacterium]|jgi:hypothetical protein
MQIVIAGGTGFLGRALVGALRAEGHRVRVLTRRPRQIDDVAWNPDPDDQRAQPWTAAIDGADAVINLAGESIAGARWNASRKQAIRESRLRATGALVLAIANAQRRPPVFISASAIGVYGNRGDERLTEDSVPGTDFLADVCRDWERIALEVATMSRVVRVRTGIVLGRGGGALAPMALPFRLFVGGPAGSGTQYMSWIHIDDWVAMVRWALQTDAVSAAINLTAPAPVTNTEFAHTLGRALGRPSFMRTPAFALRLLLGEEMATALVLGGQRVLPARAEAMGYSFKYATLDSALRAIYS